jgi:hypothetical protein
MCFRGGLIDATCSGINNGWIDPALQYQAYPIFAYNNTYKQLINERQYEKYMVRCIILLFFFAVAYIYFSVFFIAVHSLCVNVPIWSD